MRRLWPMLMPLVTIACAATSVQETPMPDLTVRLTHPKKARIYVFRSESQDFAGYAALEVELDEKRIGLLGPERFLCVEVSPGFRRFRLVHEPTGQPRRYAIGVVEAKAGQVYYCEVSFPFERNRWPQFEILEKDAGHRAMKSLQPAPLE